MFTILAQSAAACQYAHDCFEQHRVADLPYTGSNTLALILVGTAAICLGVLGFRSAKKS